MLRWNSSSRRSTASDEGAEPARRDVCDPVHEEEDDEQASALLHASPWLKGASGIPINVDGFAYEPIQRLLAISTNDGRVKVLGKIGCEATLYSAAVRPFGTRQLEFIVNRAALVRICEAGFLEAWSLGGSMTEDGESCVHSLAQIKPEGDEVLCMAIMPREPFLLLGCKSGIMRAAAFVTSAGMLSCDLHTASALQLIPYRVTPDQMQAAGALVLLASHSFAGIHLVLAMHEHTGLGLWDMRSQKLRASLNPHAKAPLCPALKDAGRVTACCWLSSAAGGTSGTGTSGGGRDFATGHEGGDVLVWSLPKLEEYVAAERAGARALPPPAVVAVLRVSSRANLAEPVRGLSCVGQPEGRDALLVLGGQSEGQPDGLTLLQLTGMAKQAVAAEQGATSEPESEDETFDPEAVTRVKMPWFGTPLGHATVPKPGNVSGTEEPAAIIQLLDGGRLVVHGMDGSKPTVFTMPFQSLQGVSTTGTCLVPGTHAPFRAVTRLTLARMREVAHRCGAMEAALDLGVVAWSMGDERSEANQALSGGIPPKPNPDLSFGTVYCTGHKDGHVRTWDVYGEQPQLLFSTPHLPLPLPSPDSPGGRLLPSTPSLAVTALELAWQHGLLLTGHANGEVRIYGFNEAPCQVHVALLDAVAPPALAHSLPSQRPKPYEPLFAHPYPPPLQVPEQAPWGGQDPSLPTHGIAPSPSHAYTRRAAQQTAAVIGEGQQGPGWQLRLMCCLHQAEISCLTYCAATRVVVVGDKTGVVSVIDVARALVLWSLPHLQLPVISACLARVRLPSQRERSLGLSPLEAGLPQGVDIPAVIVVSADACALVVSLASGHPIGKHGEMRPKSTAQVLLVELLDGEGAPVWMRDVLVANETIALAEEAAACRAAKKAEQRSQRRADKAAKDAGSMRGSSSSRGWGGGQDSDGEGGFAAAQLREAAAEGSAQGSNSEEDSDDVDDCLAAAIEKMEEAKRKERTRKVLTLGVGSDRRKTQELSLMDLAKKTAPKTGSGSEDEEERELEEAVQQSEQPVAEHMLLVTDSYIRMYSMRHVTLGSSCTSASVELAMPLIFASLFQMDHAPALLTVSQQDGCDEAAFQVYAVPSLRLLAQLPAQAALRGCTWKPPQDSALKIQRILSASRLGRALLIGEDNELLQLSPMPGDIDPLLPPVQLHDWDLAAAAHAAGVAFERAELMMRCSKGGRKRRMQQEQRQQQEVAHAEHIKYLQEMQELKRQQRKQEEEQQQQQGAKAASSTRTSQEAQLLQRSSRTSQQDERERVAGGEPPRPEGGEEDKEVAEEGEEDDTGGAEEEEEEEEGGGAELPTSSSAAADASGGVPAQQAEGGEAAAALPRMTAGSAKSGGKKKSKGLPGLLNKVGKGISKGLTTTTRTIAALPTSVASVFTDADASKQDELVLPQASFVRVDPEPFELYDSQYPDLKSLMSLPMPKDPRRNKGNREDDGIQPVRPKPLVPSNAGSSLLDSQLLPSGATSPLQGQSSVQLSSSYADADLGSQRSSVDGRWRNGAGVSVSVSLSGAGALGKDGSLRRGAAEAGSHAAADRWGASMSGVRASAPALAMGGMRAADLRTAEEGGDHGAAKGFSLDGRRAEGDAHGPPSWHWQQHSAAGPPPPADPPPFKKDKEKEVTPSGLGALFGIGSKRREATSSSQQRDPDSAGEAREDRGGDDRPLTARLAMKLGLSVSPPRYADLSDTNLSPGSELEGGSHASATRPAGSTRTPVAATASGGGGSLLSSYSSYPVQGEHRQGDGSMGVRHGQLVHTHSTRERRHSGEAGPSLPSQQQLWRAQEAAAEEEESRGELFRGSADANIRRTASDVKRKYARRRSSDGAAGAARRSETVGGVAAQTRSKLAERGEKLGAINRLTMEMQGSAAGFAEMAKQIAEQEKNKKWWQP